MEKSGALSTQAHTLKTCEGVQEDIKVSPVGVSGESREGVWCLTGTRSLPARCLIPKKNIFSPASLWLLLQGFVCHTGLHAKRRCRKEFKLELAQKEEISN